ncbi:hypothetical protein ACT3UQ_13095, partial [Glutamicibacter sp. AOP12-B1-11]|uniref:hypothetical protein n=1 Tax=Glutamicibacter sp. AOP12-B1-11 TaxID=3457725 RepID=UPI004033C3C8
FPGCALATLLAYMLDNYHNCSSVFHQRRFLEAAHMHHALIIKSPRVLKRVAFARTIAWDQASMGMQEKPGG